MTYRVKRISVPNEPVQPARPVSNAARGRQISNGYTGILSQAEQIASTYGPGIIVRRWLATSVDYCVILVLLLVPGFLLIGLLKLVGAYPLPMSGPTFIVLNLFQIFLLCLGLLYFPLLEGLTGRTIGKRLLGIMVVDQDLRPPGMRKATVRTLFRLLETNPFLGGALVAGVTVLLSTKRQRLGDMAARTFVLRIRDMEEYRQRYNLT
jgi:uncharacterized RDD family membrane protein YckC